MPVTMPPSLRILRRPEREFMVQFAVSMQDSDVRTQQHVGAPGMVQSGGTLYEIDLHTILTPVAGTIPPLRTLQFTATMFNTGTPTDNREFYLYNPTTSQVVTVVMPAALGVVNACVPFYMDASAPFSILWRTDTKQANVTNTSINLNAVLYTYDVSSYWSETSTTSSTMLVKVADQATAISESAANPNNIYYW